VYYDGNASYLVHTGGALSAAKLYAVFKGNSIPSYLFLHCGRCREETKDNTTEGGKEDKVYKQDTRQQNIRLDFTAAESSERKKIM